jgi:hypothetical protein
MAVIWVVAPCCRVNFFDGLVVVYSSIIWSSAKLHPPYTPQQPKRQVIFLLAAVRPSDLTQ